MLARRSLFLLFLFGSGFTASGQSTFGSISGAVHDPQGALVPNATVVLHRTESNTDRNITTGADGQYTALNLDPGTYTLRTQAPGFAPATANNLHLDARQQLRYDVALSIEGTARTRPTPGRSIPLTPRSRRPSRPRLCLIFRPTTVVRVRPRR